MMPNGNSQSPLEYVRLPVLAQLAAGTSVEYLPIVKFRDVRLPAWAKNGDRFVLAEVCGDSLKGEGIYHGDLALVHLTKDVNQGDLAAICSPEGMLIKFIYKELDGRFRLESANRKYKPRWFGADEIDIQGKVIRIERDL